MRTCPRLPWRSKGSTAWRRAFAWNACAHSPRACSNCRATSSSRTSHSWATTSSNASRARSPASSTIRRRSSRTRPTLSRRSAASSSARRAASTRFGSRQRSSDSTSTKTLSASCSCASRSSERRREPSSAMRSSGSWRVAEHDAVIVGSGINSLACAALLARAGWNVCLLEREPELGGAVRTAELTEPGFLHDVFSAWHPLWVGGPAHARLGAELEHRGLEYLNTEHPTGTLFPDGESAFLTTSTEANAAELERHATGDGEAWRRT